MDKLDNGDVVTIDASGWAIYKGRVHSLMADLKVMKKDLKMGSPLFDTLEEIGRHVVPLNLLDPDSPDFNPSNNFGWRRH